MTVVQTGLSQLDLLEAEGIHVMREVAAEFERPALLFSGGKDSIVMLHLAQKAFWPARIPFPLVHVDTGHNFDEVLAFRDRRAAELGARLVVAKVQDDIDAGRVREVPRWPAQPAADHHAAARHRGGPLRRRLRRRPP
jgi:sulfate adenylyltransferase subunit 2